MKHANSEMIKAVADNTELVIFCKGNSGRWKAACPADIFYNDSFLCLPQHKDACLHWLNGGDVQIILQPETKFLDWDRPSREWRPEVSFMFDNTFRIKPKKEKRWIRIARGGLALDSMVLFESEEMARDRFNHQVAQIEVEV